MLATITVSEGEGLLALFLLLISSPPAFILMISVIATSGWGLYRRKAALSAMDESQAMNDGWMMFWWLVLCCGVGALIGALFAAAT